VPIDRAPQTRGLLEPPRRLPPTAVGTLTPPPPRGPRGVTALGGSFDWHRAFAIGCVIGLALAIVVASILDDRFLLIAVSFLAGILLYEVLAVARSVIAQRLHNRESDRIYDALIRKRSKPAV
jgi:hypothetical protein